MDWKLNIDINELLSLCGAHIYWLDSNNIYRGCNEKYAASVGLRSRADIVEKKNCDLPWNKDHPEIVAAMDMANIEVIKTGTSRIVEEKAVLLDGANAVFFSHKMPMLSNTGEVLGLLCISVDITSQKLRETRLKSEKKEAVFMLYYIIAHMPAHIYWKDKDGVYLGSNDKQARSLGLKHGYELVGKTDMNLPWGEDSVKKIRENDMEVLKSGMPNVVEEKAMVDGKEVMFLSQKVALKNSDGQITGILGISIDITDRKIAKALQFESELQKAKLLEQENYQRVVEQFVHDIRAPLAVISMVVKNYAQAIPEKACVALSNAATGINDIASWFLCKYKVATAEVLDISEQRVEALCTLLLQLLSDKQHKCSDFSVEFTHDFHGDVSGSYIKMGMTDFKRMVSNLLDNAIDSLDKDERRVGVSVNVGEKLVVVTVKDNGCGMPQSIIDSIMNNAAVSTKDLNGYGIGFVQINDVLSRSHGALVINAKPGCGTEVILKFPRVSKQKDA